MTAHYQSALSGVSHAERLLVALDFDGTLSPLVDDPMSARMLPAARAAVESLCQSPDTIVALVSGRSLVDLRVIAEHDDESVILLAGSHGAEFWLPGEGIASHGEHDEDVQLRNRLHTLAVEATAHVDGVWIEPKTFGFGVHTRRVNPQHAADVHRIVDELVAREAPTWRRRSGHNIVEYAFRHEGKDSAVAELRARTNATAVLFAGDDVTDEDALATLGPLDLGVHVGAPPSAASICVPDIPAFAELLDTLAAERSRARE
ncbi:trehalose-phosphatase [Microbacterium sp. C7(2022)]|uniref:trehalose-phosphatase n=1 Tax=Microbacterium sp. C7(2022) TaxID=2992759 RepID=UPI00237C3C08|nr:trehalose-phosphatase [Microbacterium sp. C7(2022)]MDE0545631.1 trehalose-phosphatase [Microbacterium sp. C7(2022)]